jgi:hypothetical protein
VGHRDEEPAQAQDPRSDHGIGAAPVGHFEGGEHPIDAESSERGVHELR